MNNYMQVPLKIPIDTPLKNHTWKDAHELIIDPIVEQLHKQNNNMNYARKVIDEIDDQNRCMQQDSQRPQGIMNQL